MVDMSDADVERLCGYFVAKHRQLPASDDFDLVDCIVRTTVADTLLVVEGSLTVDDFAPLEVI
jgi:hypothetical protein